MRHRDLDDEDELAIADDNAPLPPARRPTRWTVRRGRAIAFVLLGLALAAGLLSVYYTWESAQSSAAQAAAVDKRLTVLEDDLAERTRQRDAERDAAAAQAEADREQFRARFCDVLTELSATFPKLDELRQALNCAPPAPAATPAAGPPAAARPSVPAAPSPDSSGPTPSPSPTPATPAPSTPPPSAPPDGPGLLCGLLPFC